MFRRSGSGGIEPRPEVMPRIASTYATESRERPAVQACSVSISPSQVFMPAGQIRDYVSAGEIGRVVADS
jgi:hypothetical protein